MSLERKTKPKRLRENGSSRSRGRKTMRMLGSGAASALMATVALVL
jgi:hypothetical protein